MVVSSEIRVLRKQNSKDFQVIGKLGWLDRGMDRALQIHGSWAREKTSFGCLTLRLYSVALSETVTMVPGRIQGASFGLLFSFGTFCEK